MKEIKPTLVIFGCTGTVGKEVMRQLKGRDCMVRGVLRNPERPYPVLSHTDSNLTYVSANLASKEQIRIACLGADVVFLLSATAPNQIEYEINIIEAAKQNGVKRIVKLSAPLIQPSAPVEVSRWHQEIDRYLIQEMDEFCCLRPHSFMQNWERNIFTIRYLGKFFGALADAKRNYIDCRDVAKVAVHYLLATDVIRQKSVVLAGPQAISNVEMASKLSYVTGNVVEYVNLSSDELFHHLTKRAKLPLWLAHHLVELDELAVKVPEPNSDTITCLIERKPRIMDEYLQENRNFFKRQPLWKSWFN